MTHSDITLCSWNSPAPLAGNTGLYLSRSVSAKQSGWLQNLWTDQERVYVVQTPVCETSRSDQRLEAVPHSHMGKHVTKHQWQSSWLMEQVARKMALLWTSVKTGCFQSRCTTQPAVFRATTICRGKHHMDSRQFYHSYLKANKVSESEGMRKVEYAYHFWKCADAVDRKLSKLVRACWNYGLRKLACFLRHSVVG